MVKKGGDRTQRPVRRILAVGLVTIALLHIASVLLQHYGGGAFNDLAPRFDLDNEFNVPTIYNAMLWSTAAFITLLHATRSRQRLEKFRWFGMASFFLYLCFDELLVLHETSARPIRNILSIPEGSPLYHAWVLPAIAATLVLAGVFASIKVAKGASHLQKNIVFYILLTGAGVIALEVLGTQLYFSSLVYKLGPVMVEELFEIGMGSLILCKLSEALLHEKPTH